MYILLILVFIGVFFTHQFCFASHPHRKLTFFEKAEKYLQLNKNCTHYQTSGQSESNEFRQINTFQNINSAEYIIKIILYVLGEKDARIVFSDSDSTNWRDHGYYEVVIGAWENTRTAIRRNPNNYPDLNSKYTPNIVNADEPLKVTFSISNYGEIQLILENSFHSTELFANDSNTISVKFISFSSLHDANVEYFYNCRMEENQLSAVSELSKKCERFESSEKIYYFPISDLNCFEPGGLKRFSLFIRGESGTRILLTNQKFLTKGRDVYEIVIGGESTNRVFIQNQNFSLTDIHYENLLSIERYLIIFVEILRSGRINIFKQEAINSKLQLLLTGTVNNPKNIRFISFQATDNKSKIEFYYACPYDLSDNEFLVVGQVEPFLSKTQLNSNCKSISDDESIKFIPINYLNDERKSKRFPMYIQGAENSHILLVNSEENYESNKFYEIIIGGWNDSRTVIRTKKPNDEEFIIASMLEDDLLSEEIPVKIIIDISEVESVITIKLLTQNNELSLRPLLFAFDNDPIEINYIAFPMDGNKDLRYFYDCSSNE